MAKKFKLWLMRMHRIEILHNVVPNLREIYLFLVRNGFFKQNLGPFSLMAAKKDDCRVKSGIFC